MQEAYNLGTIQGARVIGMEADIGSIAVGKKADLVMFGSQTPGIVVAAERIPSQPPSCTARYVASIP